MTSCTMCSPPPNRDRLWRRSGNIFIDYGVSRAALALLSVRDVSVIFSLNCVEDKKSKWKHSELNECNWTVAAAASQPHAGFKVNCGIKISYCSVYTELSENIYLKWISRFKSVRIGTLSVEFR